MIEHDGIQVLLQDRKANTITDVAGRVVAAPGDKFMVSITISPTFNWYDATRLYVDIASHDATARKPLWDGSHTQVLCIRKDASNKVHTIFEMKLWDMYLMKEEPTVRPFTIPSPYYERKGGALSEDRPPDLQARCGCIQVSFRRGHLPPTGPSTFKQRMADPYSSRQSAVQSSESCQVINPNWFKPMEGSRGEKIVFQFRNSSAKKVAHTEEGSDMTRKPIARDAPSVAMQLPLVVEPEPQGREDTPKQQSAGSHQLSAWKKMTPEPESQPGSHKPAESESDDDDEVFELAPIRLAVPKRNELSIETNRKITVTVTPRHVPTQEEQELRTPSPPPSARFSKSFGTPLSARSMTPMSSQKQRRVQMLELQLEEIRLQKELLELNDEEED